MTTSHTSKQNKRTKDEALVKQIYEFYRDHSKECDEEYALAMDSNISRIYVPLKENVEKELVKVSIVIITANKFEKNILHQCVYQKNNTAIKELTITLFEKPETHNTTSAYLFELEGYNVMHIACQVTGSYTLGGCADAVRYCINSPYVFPTAFISFGICFGCHEDKEHLCDTIMSRKIYPYFVGAKIDGKQLKTKDDYRLEMSSEMQKKIDAFKDKNMFLADALGFNVEYENYITGEAVVSSREARNLFLGITTQNIYAGDMEAYGLFKECQNAYRDIPCTVIKSICDWAILKNVYNPELYSIIMGPKANGEDAKLIKNKLQALAAFHSFQVLDILLKGIPNADGDIDKPFENSIYQRIRDQVAGEKHENTWAKDRLKKRAIKMNKELKNTIANDFVKVLCENIAQELSLDNKEQQLTRKP